MKLLKTIKSIIQEAEEQYNRACESGLPIEELDKLEKHYLDSLRLLKIYKIKESKNSRKIK
jgi:hypothetical protein